MSPTGAIEDPSRHDRRPAANPIAAPTEELPRDEPQAPAGGAASRNDSARRLEDFFIPDLCVPRAVFAVVLIAELLAVTLSLARPGLAFLTELARISLFLQWVALTGAALLCYARPFL